MNDNDEIENLVDNIKQEFIHQYQCNSPDNFEAQMQTLDEIDNSFGVNQIKARMSKALN